MISFALEQSTLSTDSLSVVFYMGFFAPHQFALQNSGWLPYFLNMHEIAYLFF